MEGNESPVNLALQSNYLRIVRFKAPPLIDNPIKKLRLARNSINGCFKGTRILPRLKLLKTAHGKNNYELKGWRNLGRHSPSARHEWKSAQQLMSCLFVVNEKN